MLWQIVLKFQKRWHLWLDGNLNRGFLKSADQASGLSQEVLAIPIEFTMTWRRQKKLDIFIPGESHEFLPTPPGFNPDLKHNLKGLLDGGAETTYFSDICAGDELTCVRKTTNLEKKNSKGLGDFLIVSSDLTYTNQHKKVVAVQSTQAIFY